MLRSSFLVSALISTLAPRPAAAQGPLRIRIASAPDEDLLGALWAVGNGSFRKAGLDVSIEKANSGAAVAAAVLGGSIEIGKSSLGALIAAHAKGLPFVVVAPAGIYDAADPTVGMIVAKDAPLRTAADLNGKTLSASSLGDQNALSMLAWIDQHGGDSRTVKFVELPSAAAPDAIAPRFLYAGYFCTAEFAARNRAAVAAFRRTLDAAAAYVNAHRAATIPVLAQFTGIEPQAIAGMPRATLGTALDPRMIQPLIDVAVKYKAIAAPFEARALLDPALA